MKQAIIAARRAVLAARVLAAHRPPLLPQVDLAAGLEVLVLQPAEVAVVVATNFH